MKRLIRSKIYAESQVGRHRGVTYGMEDNPPQRYYFVDEDGSITYAETEDEILDKIDISIESSTRI